ncbi:MAG: transcription antitermination factor NusB [Lentisphaerales bacterium]|jgi:N utilization substance protein B|nr:MAG: transcription antitermination factor NusB [Lentisphaerales bacterium]
MGKRRDARERAIQLLFQLDMNPQDVDSTLRGFWHDSGASNETIEFAESLVRGVMQNLSEIDLMIQKNTTNWDISRIGKVEKCVLRLAFYELLYRTDIPPVVSINEAIEIAKLYGGGEASGKFINGILDNIRRDLHRPARTAGKSPSEANATDPEPEQTEDDQPQVN